MHDREERNERLVSIKTPLMGELSMKSSLPQPVAQHMVPALTSCGKGRHTACISGLKISFYNHKILLSTIK